MGGVGLQQCRSTGDPTVFWQNVCNRSPICMNGNEVGLGTRCSGYELVWVRVGVGTSWFGYELTRSLFNAVSTSEAIFTARTC